MDFGWVTRVSGTGKSTVRVELAKRGYQSLDADEDGIASGVFELWERWSTT